MLPERPFRWRSLRTARLYVALLLILPTSAVWAQDDRDPGDLLEDGRQAFEREDFTAAREDLWAYLDATASLTGPERMPQAEALYMIAVMEPDASVAARHYRIIADEFPAASIADQALFRLAQYDFVQGRAIEARSWFGEIQQNYPYSRLQAELPLWIGRTYMLAGAQREAAGRFLDGFTRVKSGELTREMSGGQREALEAEYAWWLATAWEEAGDPAAAAQYWSLLTLDYADSPQAAEARASLGDRGGPVGQVAVGSEAPRWEPVDEGPQLREVPPSEEPAGQEPAGQVAAGQVAPPPVAPTPEPRPVEREPASRPIFREAVPQPRPAGEAGVVYLQVGAFTSATNAADLSQRLKADGFDSHVAVAVVDGRGFYRVRVGPYRLPEDEPRAVAIGARLRERGYPYQQVSASP